MSDLVKYALLGLGASAVYALTAAGVVLVYRGSRVVNFAQGGFALVAGYAYLDLHGSVPVWLAVVIAVASAAACGLVTEFVVMRPMRHASPLARVIASLGVLAVITQLAELRYGDQQSFVEGFLPRGSVRIGADIILPADRLWLFAIATGLTAALWAWSRFSAFGLATSAVGENEDALSALGWSPRAVASINWTLGAALAGLAGVLLVPLSSVSPTAFALTIVPALSAALVGNFSSFWLTLAGAIIIGILESETTRWLPAPGWNVGVPFLVIIAILVSRGGVLPARSFLSDRLPAVGTGRVRIGWSAAILALTLASLFAFPPAWADAVSTSAIFAVIGLSLVVVTGYAGQISLAQYALAGMGALLSSRAAAAFGLPFPAALVVGTVLTIPVGILVSLPALRARGVDLAVATLGLAVVIQSIVLGNTDFTGGLLGTNLAPPTLFGLPIESVERPERYAVICLGALFVASLAVANIRRGRSGRHLLAVRDNERAAASVGVNVIGAKVHAFAVGAGLAAIGGVLLAFRHSAVEFGQFSALGSISAVMLIVIGGVGYIAGAAIAGALVGGGIVEHILHRFFDLSGVWLLVLGVLLLVQIVLLPDGLVHRQVQHLRHLFARARPKPRCASDQHSRPPIRVDPKTLALEQVSVRFGGNLAVDGVNITISPGEVVGLIGPNGAGKTTLIDVATGFVRPTRGAVRLDGQDISQVSAQKRVRLGVARAWQSLELFSVMTVEENLRTAAEPGSFWTSLLDLVWPRKRPLPPIVQAVIHGFGLEAVLQAYPDSLPYATRRLVGMARALATNPSVLLLDEPAAGLDDSSSAELADLIGDLARQWGIAVLLVEHDVAMVMRVCDRVVAVDFGREIVTGTPEEVRSHPRVMEAYLGHGQPAEPASIGSASSGGAQAGAARQVMLETSGLSVGYGHIPVVRDLDLVVSSGEIVTLLGANGAGKTTALMGIAGLLSPSKGAVKLRGRATTSPLHVRSRAGLAYVPEQRGIFRNLTTRENLRLGRGDPQKALELMPELRGLLDRRAGLLSGGEQQMLSLARALASKPAILLCDELSLGLAPIIVDRLLQAIRAASRGGLAVLLVEQHVRAALSVADRAYVLRRGSVVISGTRDDVSSRLDEVESSYLSVVRPGDAQPGRREKLVRNEG